MQKKFYIVTLGCPKNDVESDIIRTKLNSNFKETFIIESADIIIINTCAFIKSAITQSDDTIKKIITAKKKKQTVVVTGCYIGRNKQMLEDKFDDKILIIPISELELLNKTQRKNQTETIKRTNFEKLNYSYIKISEGCNKRCGYCSIPKIKGKYISRDIDSILAESETLLNSGIKELILVSQDTCYYGFDQHKKNALTDLLMQLSKFKTDYRIRLMYLNPDDLTKKLLKFISDNEKICKYLDMPIQHTETEILKTMRRNNDTKKIFELVKTIRAYNNNIAIRSVVITGYPGETPEIFKKMLHSLQQLKFDKLGCFEYSDEPDTFSFTLKNKIPQKIKTARFNTIMRQQQKISAGLNAQKIGNIHKIIIDGYDSNNDLYLARDEFNAPEIDGYVLFKTKKKIDFKKFYNIKIQNSTEYDLIGELIE